MFVHISQYFEHLLRPICTHLSTDTSVVTLTNQESALGYTPFSIISAHLYMSGEINWIQKD